VEFSLLIAYMYTFSTHQIIIYVEHLPSRTYKYIYHFKEFNFICNCFKYIIMLLTCPLYSNLRKRYGFEFKDTSIERFVYVLASENKCVLSRLAAFVFYATQTYTCMFSVNTTCTVFAKCMYCGGVEFCELDIWA
jgi:hypothetical protein